MNDLFYGLFLILIGSIVFSVFMVSVNSYYKGSISDDVNEFSDLFIDSLYSFTEFLLFLLGISLIFCIVFFCFSQGALFLIRYFS